MSTSRPESGIDRARVTALDRSIEPLWRVLVGSFLRSAQQAAGLRLVDVAARAGVSAHHLSEIERGVEDPSSEMLAAVPGVLRLRVLDLAGRAARRQILRRVRGPGRFARTVGQYGEPGVPRAARQRAPGPRELVGHRTTGG